jgi:hypothetical protein
VTDAKFILDKMKRGGSRVGRVIGVVIMIKHQGEQLVFWVMLILGAFDNLYNVSIVPHNLIVCTSFDHKKEIISIWHRHTIIVSLSPLLLSHHIIYI